MKTRNAAIFLAVVLAGCTSLNVLHIGPGVVFNPAPEVEPAKPAPEVAVRKPPSVVEIPPPTPSLSEAELKGLCPAFKFDNIPDTPSLPVKELSTIDIHDPKAVNRVLYKHIDELRNHLSKLKNKMVLERKGYAAECKQYLERIK